MLTVNQNNRVTASNVRCITISSVGLEGYLGEPREHLEPDSGAEAFSMRTATEHQLM
jgi:hypothetical protein